jgi:enamine deaminase RidA (YjgF/YER057c/UK114 family)
MVVYIASMTTRINISTGSPFEPLRGYSRAVQQGDMLFISGTTALNAMGDVVAPGEPYAQTIAILNKVRTILTSRNFAVSDVVRTRIFVTNIVKWEDYARAHSDFFEKIRPASSLVQVAKLVDPRLVVEIEVDAIRGASSVENVALDL